LNSFPSPAQQSQLCLWGSDADGASPFVGGVRLSEPADGGGAIGAVRAAAAPRRRARRAASQPPVRPSAGRGCGDCGRMQPGCKKLSNPQMKTQIPNTNSKHQFKQTRKWKHQTPNYRGRPTLIRSGADDARAARRRAATPAASRGAAFGDLPPLLLTYACL